MAIEQPPKFENTEGEGGWKGNWRKGDRPEGYIETDFLYRELKEKNYQPVEILGKDFVERHNELRKKAQGGSLDQSELEEFLETNATLHESLKKYKRWYEAESDPKVENREPTGWQGNWENNDRPEGYREFNQRYTALRKLGFRSTEALGADFVVQYNELIRQARATGRLNQDELEKLADCYRQLNESMDEYESRSQKS